MRVIIPVFLEKLKKMVDDLELVKEKVFEPENIYGEK